MLSITTHVMHVRTRFSKKKKQSVILIDRVTVLEISIRFTPIPVILIYAALWLVSSVCPHLITIPVLWRLTVVHFSKWDKDCNLQCNKERNTDGLISILGHEPVPIQFQACKALCLLRSLLSSPRIQWHWQIHCPWDASVFYDVTGPLKTNYYCVNHSCCYHNLADISTSAALNVRRWNAHDRSS